MKNDPTSNRRMNEILIAKDRLRFDVIHRDGGMLAHLWRTILMERGIGIVEFNTATTQYIQRARRRQSISRTTSYFSRSNIYREMSKPSMTFKVFIKAMKLIGVARMTVQVGIERKGLTSMHDASMNIGAEDGYEISDDDDDDES